MLTSSLVKAVGIVQAGLISIDWLRYAANRFCMGHSGPHGPPDYSLVFMSEQALKRCPEVRGVFT